MASPRRRDWANLMPEALSLVAQRLSTVDYANFSAVCTSWAWIASPANGMPPPLPLRTPHPFVLLLRPDQDRDRSVPLRALLDAFSGDRRYELDPLPEMHGKRVIGSQFGWLVIVHTDSSHLFLLNPFTRARIDLPWITTLPHSRPCYLWAPGGFCKVVLSSNPSGSNFMAVAMFGHQILALFRTGDEAWSFWDNHDKIWVADVSFWEGMAVALSNKGDTYEMELTHSPGTTVVHRLINVSAPYTIPYTAQYLVKSSGDVLLRVLRGFDYRVEVQILARETKRWDPISCLSGLALFISAAYSMSIPASAEMSMKENCVFLTELNRVFDISHGAWDRQPPQLRRIGDVWITSP